MYFIHLLAAADGLNVGGIDSSAVIVALISIIGTLGAAWLMLRGKTQDTANWLIIELRNEAKAAREVAQECNDHREEDRTHIDDLRGLVAGLQAGLRRATRENEHLRDEIEILRHTQESVVAGLDEIDCSDGHGGDPGDPGAGGPDTSTNVGAG